MCGKVTIASRQTVPKRQMIGYTIRITTILTTRWYDSRTSCPGLVFGLTPQPPTISLTSLSICMSVDDSFHQNSFLIVFNLVPYKYVHIPKKNM